MRTLILAAAALFAAACTPMPSVETAATTDAPVQSADAGACAARGGEMRQVGRMQSWQCIVKYTDAGKDCTDGDQCQGDCRVEGNTGLASGTAATGQCQVDSDRFGCHTVVEDGRAGSTLCVD